MSTLHGLRFELFVEQRDGAPAVNPVIAALLQQLAREGAAVTVRTPETELVDPGRTRADMILLKSANPLAIAAALAAERAGALVLNPATATARANDKAAAVAALAAAGVAVPATLLADASCTGADLAGDWVAKPVRGLHGAGVHAGASFREALAGVAAAVNGSTTADDRVRIVQRRVGTEAADVKVYVAGAAIFAGHKRFEVASFRSDTIAPIEPTPAIRAAAHAAGAALELTLFGLDLRRDGRTLYAVDVNPFPGYRGFPAAAPALRHEILRQAAKA